MRSIHRNRKILESKHRERFFTRAAKQRFHLENIPWLKLVVKSGLAVTFTEKIGQRNAEDVRLNEAEFAFADLPKDFDGTRLLFITDLHIDAVNGLTEKIINIADRTPYDFCILGGDYSFRLYDNCEPVKRNLSKLVARLREKSKVFGILGNHDEYSIGEFLADLGVDMLINENNCLSRGGEKIYLVGVDDCHYYGAHDLEQAGSGIPAGAFKIMVCHSPELYREAASADYSFYMAGHTHGGQICLPGSIAVICLAAIPSKLIKGKWQYRGMKGYTSQGVGSTIVPVRFFCPPEVAVITLKKTVVSGSN